MRYTISLLAASFAALPALAEVPRVVTDFVPAQALVSQVMGDLGQPQMLLTGGSGAHDFQLRPSQAGMLADADLVVWVGPQMTRWLDKGLEGIGAKAARLTLLEVPGTYLQDFQEKGAKAEAGQGGDDHGHDDHGHDDHGHENTATEAPAADGHAHDGLDPHAWLDPGNAPVWLQAIAAELSRIDPENAATYAANAAAAAKGYASLEAELSQAMQPLAGKPFVVAHDAYGYFVSHYGLSVAGAVQLGDATASGAETLAGLRAEMEAGGVVCLFPEVAHDPKQAQLLVEGTAVRLGAALDPEGAMLEPGPEALIQLLRGLARDLADCLGA